MSRGRFKSFYSLASSLSCSKLGVQKGESLLLQLFLVDYPPRSHNCSLSPYGAKNKLSLLIKTRSGEREPVYNIACLFGKFLLKIYRILCGLRIINKIRNYIKSYFGRKKH